MGSPLSSVLGDLVMENLLDSVVPKLSFGLVFIRKYVDDLITSVPLDKIDEVLMVFNSFHTRLQFTVKCEVEGRIPFLDMELVRSGDTVRTKWYSKPMSSGRLLNYNSDHMHAQKINTAYELIRRALLLSSPDFKQESLEKAKKMLLQNGYEHRIIRGLVARNSSVRSTTEADSTKVAVTKYRSLAYWNCCSEQIAKTIKMYHPSMGLGFKSYNTLYSMFFTKLKQKVPRLLCSELIYKINCADCDAAYVGHTKSYLKIRISGHKSDVNAGNVEKCATALHAVEEQHTLKFDEVEILGFSNNLHKRLVLEMLYINSQGTMNRKTDTDGISKCYASILDKVKND